MPPVRANTWCNTLLSLLSTILCLTAVSATAITNDGTVSFSYQDESFRTYYKVVGNLANRTRIPLVVVHGGPGIPHEYLLPLSDLARGPSPTPVIFYDQIGNGGSTHLRGRPSSFFTIDLFISELANLIERLGINDSFDMLGHSWGGALGAEFAVREQPKGLKHLILSNSLASSALWDQSRAQLMKTMPEDVQKGMVAPVGDPQLPLALRKFYEVHGCTVKPFPQGVQDSLDQVFPPSGDPTVSTAHVLRGWTIVNRLHLVRQSVLVINGARDISQDFVVEPFYQNIASVKWITFSNSTHMPFWEERVSYMQVVASFLSS